VDLLIVRGGRRIGYEIKHTDSPKLTESMVTAEETLHTDRFFVVYPGNDVFPLSRTIQATGLTPLIEDHV